MLRKFVLVSVLSLAVSASAVAQPQDGGDTAAVRTVLANYKSSLERLDLENVERLFAVDSQIIESGKIEGTYANYRDHHIGPELAEFSSFKFADYSVQVRIEGALALTTETYRYSIHLKDKPDVIERRGVATSVLRKVDGRWQIASMHSSSRKP